MGRKSQSMIDLYVTYPGDSHTRFDRSYYVAKHLPLVRKSWAPYGLQSAEAFFPQESGAGTIAVCLCVFRDEQSVREAFTSPVAAEVMDDVVRFTDAKPSQSTATPL